MFILVASVVSYFEILNIQATKSVTKIQYKLVTSDIRNSLAIYEKEYLDFYLKFQSIRNSLETILIHSRQFKFSCFFYRNYCPTSIGIIVY